MTQGNILIASKKLKDSFFENSVVLTISSKSEPELPSGGVFGVIINTSESPYLTPKCIKSIMDAFKKLGVNEPEIHKDKIRLGGPVSGPIVCLHNIPYLGKEIAPNIYWTIDITEITQIVVIPNAEFRLYLGISSWDDQQLENEIQSGAWHTLSFNETFAGNICDETLIFNQDHKSEIWEKAIKIFSNNFYAQIGVKILGDYRLN